MWYIYIYAYAMEYYSAIQKKRNNPICDMNRLWEYHAKQNKSVRKNLRILWFHPYMGYRTETHRHQSEAG